MAKSYGSLYPRSPMGSFAQDFAGGLQVGQHIGDTVRGIGQQALVKSIGDAVNKAGGDINAIDTDLYSTPEGMMALGTYLDGYVNSKEGLLKAKEAHSKVAQQQYQYMQSGLDYLEQHKDDPRALAAGIEQLSRNLDLPYHVKVAEDGNLDLFYQDRTGDKPTGQRVTPQDALISIRDVVQNSDKFHQLYAQNALAIIAGNNRYKQDPSTWFYAQGDDGQSLTLIPQKQTRPEGGIDVGYIVLQKGKPAQFATLEQLAGQYGITPETWDQHYQNQKLENDKIKLAYEGQRVAREWAAEQRLSNQQGKPLTKPQFRQAVKGYTHAIMSDMGYVYKNGSYYAIKEDSLDGTSIDLSKPAPIDIVKKAREEARRQVEEDYGITDPLRKNGSSAAPQDVKGLIEAGNINLANRPIVENPDGSFSTVESKSFNIDGQEVLLPTISDDGKRLTDEQVINLYKMSGRHLGKFSSSEAATRYAEQLHKEQEKQYADKRKRNPSQQAQNAQDTLNILAKNTSRTPNARTQNGSPEQKNVPHMSQRIFEGNVQY